MNDQLKKVLNENGIAPAPEPTIKERFDEKFGNPTEQLDDIFGMFGRIYSDLPFEADRQANYKKAEADEKKKNGKK